MSTALKFPRGSTVYFLLSWTRDGAQLDLTGATLAASLKTSPLDADADALALTTGDNPALAFTWSDLPAGLAILKFTAAATSAVTSAVPPVWQAQATLATGDVIISEAHQGPVYLTPLAYPGLCAEQPPVPGVTATLEPGGTVQLLPPAMANYVLNRPDLTGLTGGTSVKLDGLSAATLAALQSGAKVELSLTGDIELQYRLRARTESEAESAPFVILCDHDGARCWALTRVQRSGLPCTYNAGTAKWHKEWAVGADGSATTALDATGFTIPT